MIDVMLFNATHSYLCIRENYQVPRFYESYEFLCVFYSLNLFSILMQVWKLDHFTFVSVFSKTTLFSFFFLILGFSLSAFNAASKPVE